MPEEQSQIPSAVSQDGLPPAETPHKRRVRYKGKNPRRFEDKYKELQPERYADTVAKVLASGKTPAGQHVPIMLTEILQVLSPQPGERVVDCTLGYGGHTEALLQRILPYGSLLGLDQDPIEIEKTTQRLRGLGFGEDQFRACRTNFAAIRRALDQNGWADGGDVILADLGVSSMQIDNPTRGFSTKLDGPLDMRMNPQRGLGARELLKKLNPTKLAALLQENADEPNAALLSEALAGKDFQTTLKLAGAIKAALPKIRNEEDMALTVRRVFQALRIAVNDEFSALDSFLREIPGCLRSGGRVAVLTFHSGEDRRVKKAFQAAKQAGIFSIINDEVQRPSQEEIRANSRASSAKLRWAIKC